MSHVLTCHPDTPCRAVRGIEVRANWTADAALAVSYQLEGALMAVRIPPPSLARRGDRLWQHTCFEAFIAADDKPNYYEFNFAPSSEWAIYGFRSYREAMPLGEEPDPKIVVRRMGDALEVEVVIRWDRLTMIQPCKRLRLGLSAVIEENDGRLSYWALRHSSGKPDFHSPDTFAVKMEPPGQKLERF